MKTGTPQHVFYLLFLFLCKCLQYRLHYIKVRFARCSPITSSCTLKGLQYQLHRHFRQFFLHSTLCIYVSSRKSPDNFAPRPPITIFAHWLAPHSKLPPLTSFEGALLNLQYDPQPRRKRAPVYYTFCQPPMRLPAMSTSPLPATLSPLYPPTRP